jgi:RsiW-degrading membrane proteinase PrsW (M82 family)
MLTCLLGLVLSVLVTLVPTLTAIAILWWLDRYEKDPLWLLGIAFFWGAVPAIVLSLVAELVLDVPLSALLSHPVLYSLTNNSILAPLIEETFKALLLLVVFVLYRDEFDGVVDGVLYGALVGFGFAVVEDVFYLMSSLLEDGWGNWGLTAAIRVGLYNLNHALFSACVGAGFGLARISKRTWEKGLYPVLGWTLAVSLHGLHNAGITLAETTAGVSCLLFTGLDWIGVLGMLILIGIAVQLERRWLQELLPEVEDGVITPDEYQIASLYWARFARGWRILSRYGPLVWFRWNRYVQTIVDLGYKKHQRVTAGEGTTTEERIADLRQRIARLRPRLPPMGEEA